MQLQEGLQLLNGKYTLTAKLGEGGMATVWSARRHAPGQVDSDVVLKVLSIQGDDVAERRHMFQEEARLAVQLFHPYIARVFAVEQWEGLDFLVMERVWGKDLETLIRLSKRQKQPIPWPYAIRLISMAAQALHYANTQTDAEGVPFQLVHRDIKPANLLFTTDGQLKIIDFGIAKASVSQLKTQTGMVKGTIAYMSPEQLKAETLDIRSDLFALGVSLFELCTLKRPFHGENFTSLMFAILTQDAPSAHTYAPHLPQELNTLLAQTLHKDKTQRSKTALGFCQSLESILQVHQQSVSQSQLQAYFAHCFPSFTKTWSRRRQEQLQSALSRVRTPLASPSLTSQVDPAQPPTGEVLIANKQVLHTDQPLGETANEMVALDPSAFGLHLPWEDSKDALPEAPGSQTQDKIRAAQALSAPPTVTAKAYVKPKAGPALSTTAQLPSAPLDLEEPSSTPSETTPAAHSAAPRSSSSKLVPVLLGCIILLLAGIVGTIALRQTAANKLGSHTDAGTQRLPDANLGTSTKLAKAAMVHPRVIASHDAGTSEAVKSDATVPEARPEPRPEPIKRTKPSKRTKKGTKRYKWVRLNKKWHKVPKSWTAPTPKAGCTWKKSGRRSWLCQTIKKPKPIKVVKAIQPPRPPSNAPGRIDFTLQPSCRLRVLSPVRKTLGEGSSLFFKGKPGVYKLLCFNRRKFLRYKFKATIKAGKTTNYTQRLKRGTLQVKVNPAGTIILSGFGTLGGTSRDHDLYEGSYRATIWRMHQGKRQALRRSFRIRSSQTTTLRVVWP